MFTDSLAISIGIGHINVSELVKSISTLLAAVISPNVYLRDIPPARFTCCDFFLSLRRMGLVQQLEVYFLLWEDRSEPAVQPKGTCGYDAYKQHSDNPVWIQFL